MSVRVEKHGVIRRGLIDVVHTQYSLKKKFGGTGLSQVVANVLGNFMVMIAWHAILGG